MFRIVLFLLAFSAPAFAGPDRISLLFGSNHVGTDEQFEEVNPGIFLEWDTPGPSITVGAYRNSYGRASIAAGAHVPVFERGDFHAEVFAGAAYYPENGRDIKISVGDVVPLLGLRLRYRALYVLAIPSDSKPVDAIIGYGLTFPLQ